MAAYVGKPNVVHLVRDRANMVQGVPHMLFPLDRAVAGVQALPQIYLSHSREFRQHDIENLNEILPYHEQGFIHVFGHNPFV